MYKVHASTEEDIACHRGKGVAGTYGAETSDCDSPLSLVDATLDWIATNLKDEIDFVIWTGDTARHDSDEKHPRTTAQVLDMNRLVADKFVSTFSNDKKKLDIPIVPTFGNNDFLPHNIFYPGPNRWLVTYADIWKKFIPEEQRHAFTFGGWFSVEVIPGRLAVFSLNTMYFFDRNAAVDGCAVPSEPGFKHMEWLRVQLQQIRERGMKAILIGHVPPARTGSKQNWDETCWQKYTLWLKQYKDVVTGSIYGHMNIDHFLLQDTEEVDLDAIDAAVRGNMDEGVDMASKGDYLNELREEWSDLPQAVEKAWVDDVEDLGKKKKKKDKFKKIGGKYAERYHLSLVSASVVPNFLPTLRVVQYNISGLNGAAVWMDENDATDEYKLPAWADAGFDQDVWTEKKKKHKTKPKDPNLVIPEPPSKDAGPGPAYFPQTFTFTNYTQYFANLTYINNDIEAEAIEDQGWRDGDHVGKQPKNPQPKPREFRYEVEYETRGDKFFKLPDLTVRSFLKLAYRIGGGEVKGLEFEGEDEDDDDDEEEQDDEVDADRKGKKHKKKKKKHHKNKAWLHFLDRAFVRTVSKKDLKDY